ncbi:hypothetical protein GEMRC1_003513 [Eukaryota sp. GEM-RC1]
MSLLTHLTQYQDLFRRYQHSVSYDTSSNLLKAIRNALVGSRAIKQLFLDLDMLPSLLSSYPNVSEESRVIILACITSLMNTYPQECAAALGLLVDVIGSNSSSSDFKVVLGAVKSLSALLTHNDSILEQNLSTETCQSLVVTLTDHLTPSTPASSINAITTLLSRFPPALLTVHAHELSVSIMSLLSSLMSSHPSVADSLFSLLRTLSLLEPSSQSNIVQSHQTSIPSDTSILTYFSSLLTSKQKLLQSRLYLLSFLSSLRPHISSTESPDTEYSMYLLPTDLPPFSFPVNDTEKDLLLRVICPSVLRLLRHSVDHFSRSSSQSFVISLSTFTDLFCSSQFLRSHIINSIGVPALIKIIESVTTVIQEHCLPSLKLIDDVPINVLRIIASFTSNIADSRRVVMDSSLKGFLFSQLCESTAIKNDRTIKSRLILSCLCFRNVSRSIVAVLPAFFTVEDLSLFVPLITSDDCELAIPATAAFANISREVRLTKEFVLSKNLIPLFVQRFFSYTTSLLLAKVSANALSALCRDCDQPMFETIMDLLCSFGSSSVRNLFDSPVKIETLALFRNLAWCDVPSVERLIGIFGDSVSPSSTFLKLVLSFPLHVVSCAPSDKDVVCAEKALGMLSNIGSAGENFRYLIMDLPGLSQVVSGLLRSESRRELIIAVGKKMIDWDLLTNLGELKEHFHSIDLDIFSRIENISSKLQSTADGEPEAEPAVNGVSLAGDVPASPPSVPLGLGMGMFQHFMEILPNAIADGGPLSFGAIDVQDEFSEEEEDDEEEDEDDDDNMMDF